MRYFSSLAYRDDLDGGLMTLHDDVLDCLGVEYVDESAPLSVTLAFVVLMFWSRVTNV